MCIADHLLYIVLYMFPAGAGRAAPAAAGDVTPRPTPPSDVTDRGRATHCLLFGRRELPRLEHGVPRGGAHVCGRGGIHSICHERSLLQVSRSTQKLLPVPKVSEQKTDQR